jgi:hypothetical protein
MQQRARARARVSVSVCLSLCVCVGTRVSLTVARCRYLEAMAVLDLPLLESTGEYFIVSAASALTSLTLPSFVSASGIIAGRSVSFDGPWLVLEEINLPLLEEVVGCALPPPPPPSPSARHWLYVLGF